MQKIPKYIIFKEYPPNDIILSDTFILNTKYQITYETTYYYVYTKNDHSEVAVSKSYENQYYTIGDIQTSNACKN